MVKYLILSFTKQQDADVFMDLLDDIASPEKGYDQWDTVKESPEGTFYIFSPTGDARFPDWKEKIPNGWNEKYFPNEWIEEDNA